MCFGKLMEQLFCVKITVEKYRREHVKNMEVLGYYSTFLILEEKRNKTKQKTQQTWHLKKIPSLFSFCTCFYTSKYLVLIPHYKVDDFFW